jgi:hypothetical protein
MIAVHQNVNMFIRRAMKCSEGSIWSGFAVSDYDIQICGGGTVCPNATYRQFKAAIGDPIYNGRFVPRCSHLHPENAAVSTKVRYAGCYRSIGSLRWRSALGR